MHLPTDPHIFGVVVENPRYQRGCYGHFAGHHRHALFGVEWWCLQAHFHADHPFCLEEFVGRLLIADADPLFAERVVAIGELLEPLLAAAQFAIEPSPLRADGPIAIGHKVAFRFFLGAQDRFANRDLDLAAESRLRG